MNEQFLSCFHETIFAMEYTTDTTDSWGIARKQPEEETGWYENCKIQMKWRTFYQKTQLFAN